MPLAEEFDGARTLRPRPDNHPVRVAGVGEAQSGYTRVGRPRTWESRTMPIRKVPLGTGASAEVGRAGAVALVPQYRVEVVLRERSRSRVQR